MPGYLKMLKHRSALCILLGLCLLILCGTVWYWIRSWSADQAFKPLTVPFASSASNEFYLERSERYFIYLTFQPVGSLSGIEEDFLTPRAKSIPCDLKILLAQGGTILKEETIASLKPAFGPSPEGRFGYRLLYFDTNKSGPCQLSIEGLSSLDAYSVADLRLEVHLNPADWEGRMILRDVSNFVFVPGMILAGILVLTGALLTRHRRNGIASATASDK